MKLICCVSTFAFIGLMFAVYADGYNAGRRSVWADMEVTKTIAITPNAAEPAPGVHTDAMQIGDYGRPKVVDCFDHRGHWLPRGNYCFSADAP